jgi:hypothetical protein
VLLIWLASLAAVGGSPEEWSSTYDARLSQALGAEPSEAIAVYETLVAQIPAEQEQRGEVLYWLGRARWSAGDLLGAKRSLESARSYRSSRARARSLLGRISVGEQAIRRLPYTQDHRLTPDPWVRGWERGQDADLVVEDGPDGRALMWSTKLEDGKTDFLVFGFDTDGVRVSSIEVSIRSEAAPAKIRVVLEDDQGRLWVSPRKTVRMARWTALNLPIGDFISEETRGQPDGRRLKSITLQDLTALHTNARGDNIMWLDDLRVR